MVGAGLQTMQKQKTMKELTPKEIVAALDRHIVGQAAAKRAAAIAIRNRWRRQQLPDAMRNEVGPANMILIGPTGVGKTEIARRLAKLVNAPFIKVEATKYTEVGYHGRDVENIIRELLELAVHMVRTEQALVVETEARRLTEERLLDALIPSTEPPGGQDAADAEAAERRRRSREKLRVRLRAGALDDSAIEIGVQVKAAPIGVMANMGMDQLDPEMQSFLERLVPPQSKQRSVSVREAREIIFEQECDKLIDREKVIEMAIYRTEHSGIVFIDELDKLAAPGQAHGPDISRQGVQRDLLPIIEGCTVTTRHGPVRTDHVLFIAAGAFHSCKPSDLMPELQGRLPIRVELEDLTQEDFVRILTQPENALTKQHVALMSTEGIKLTFADDAVDQLAATAYRLNQSTENIGARRLVTVMEKVMEEISFTAPQRSGDSTAIDACYVRDRLSDISEDADLSRFIL